MCFCKYLICGERHSGKSTLIQKLFQHIRTVPHGFYTKSIPDTSGSRVILFSPYHPETFHTIMIRSHNTTRIFPEIMDAVATQYLQNIPVGAAVVMDELGFIESSAFNFQNAVFHMLDGPYHVFAAVKEKDTPFLNRVRAHPLCRRISINPANRDAAFLNLIAELDAN